MPHISVSDTAVYVPPGFRIPIARRHGVMVFWSPWLRFWAQIERDGTIMHIESNFLWVTLDLLSTVHKVPDFMLFFDAMEQLKVKK